MITMSASNFSEFNYVIPYIRYCAEDRYREPWVLKKRKIADYELIFITNGTGVFSIEDREYNVSPNDLIIFRPETSHSAQSLELPFEFLCIHFDLYVSDMKNSIQAKSCHFNKSIPTKPIQYHKALLNFPEYTMVNDSSFIHMLFKRIHHETTEQLLGYTLVVKSLFIDLLYNLFRQEKIENVRQYPEAVLAIIEYLKTHLAEHIHLSDLADFVHLQPSYISSLFKKHTGLTITEYVRMYRLSLSKQLLLETDRKIEDIACCAGFYDLHHFSRVFKMQEGIAPAQYRVIKR